LAGPVGLFRFAGRRVAVTLVVMSDVTRLLENAAAGDRKAADDLLPLVYDELRKLAASRLAAETPGQTLQATALVHEAYVRLVGPANRSGWDGHGHFFSAAAEAMRRILIDRARHKGTRKAGGDRARHDIGMVEPTVDEPDVELLTLDEALQEFERVHPRKAEVVKLRFFAGLTSVQVAKALDVSTSTVENDWAYARSWLRLRMGDAEGERGSEDPAPRKS
jgi:RNA polymerase sigma factor (TIGR02999 family)